MNKTDKRKLKKALTDGLRHDPDRFGFELDDNGSIAITKAFEALDKTLPFMFTKNDLDQVLEKDSGRLFEMSDNRVRAKTGHTTDAFEYPTDSPPEHLYYVIKERDRWSYEAFGLDPKEGYVDVYETPEKAHDASNRRRIKTPVLIKLWAKQASESGVSIYRYCNQWYVQHVPFDFLEFQ